MREREVIKLLAEKMEIGDDCSVIPLAKTHLLLTTDMLHRKTDFPDGMDSYTIGWRAVAVSLSDIAAMGGKPLAVTVALGAPEFERAFIEKLRDGIIDCAQHFDVSHFGGDLDQHEELTLVSSALGEATKPILRKGAKAGELVCVTGELGRTAVALELYKQKDLETANEMARFVPRVKEGLVLAPFATSMMDISDGLARSLYQLAEASKVGFKIDMGALPFSVEAEELARSQEELMELCLYMGEDYELLFTLSQEKLLDAKRACEFVVIGQVTKESVQMKLGADLMELPDRGYEHGNNKPRRP
ncbi:thiamine-phosphate kinase [Candidatus Acetothermia bacterium]|nr:thiamine-phosphate kinase [Candidatus Acetothermia bacterium]